MAPRYFETLGINVYDAWSFFKLLDEDGGGSVEPEVARLHLFVQSSQGRGMKA